MPTFRWVTALLVLGAWTASGCGKPSAPTLPPSPRPAPPERDRDPLDPVSKDPVGGWTEGLKGEYYEGRTFDSLLLRRVDSIIRVSFEESRWLAPERSSLRWEGFLSVPEDGDYVFVPLAIGEGAVSVWLHGGLAAQSDKGEFSTYAASRLRKGVHPVRVDYVPREGAAFFRMDFARVRPGSPDSDSDTDAADPGVQFLHEGSALEPFVKSGLDPGLVEAGQVDSGRVIPLPWSEWEIKPGDENGWKRFQETYLGRSGVLMTHPYNGSLAASLEREFPLPARKRAALEFSVASSTLGDWELRVLLDGKLCLRRLVAGNGREWLPVRVDLSEFAGKKVRVRLENFASDWQYEFGYWSDMALRLESPASALRDEPKLPEPKTFRAQALGLRSLEPGLSGAFFHGTGFDRLATERVDPMIAFDWGRGAAWPGGPPDGFSIRWSGFVRVAQTGPYTFETRSDDGVRLYIDDTLIIDRWGGPSSATGHGVLEAGLHKFVLEYFEGGGDARVLLLGREDSYPVLTVLGPETLFHKGDGGRLRARDKPVQSASFSPDGAVLASGSEDGSIQLWEVASGKETRTVGEREGAGRAIAFDPRGGLLASTVQGNAVALWDPRTGERLATFAGHSAAVECLAFGADGALLASGARDGTVKVWDVRERTERRTLLAHSAPVTGVALDRSGSTLASASLDASARLWDWKTGREIARFADHPGGVRALACTRDGARLATAGADKAVKVWDFATGAELLTLDALSAPAACLAFSPDGSVLSSGASDGTIRLWDIETGIELRSLGAHSGEVTALASSPDGETLVTGSRDGSLRVWDVSALPQRRGRPDREGFIRNWLLLGPIALGPEASQHTERVQKGWLDRDWFPGQRQARPKGRDRVAVQGSELQWGVAESTDYFVNLGATPNSLFLGVTYIRCDREMKDVRLSIGSDDSSCWTFNGSEVVRFYGGRGVGKDQNRSEPLVLAKGLNVLAFAVINGGGPSGGCARFLDPGGSPLVEPIRIVTPTLSPASAASGVPKQGK
jgi:WD40 repeat protein